MMSLSGAYADQTTGMLPLEDIAVGLARIPRFGGQTKIWWTVAEHLLAGMIFTRGLYDRRITRDPALALHVGLHDAHEAMTSDVPTCFKTDDLKRLQQRLDVRLYAALGLPFPSPAQAAEVAWIDRALLRAEAWVVCPRATYDAIVKAEDYPFGPDTAEYSPECDAVRSVIQPLFPRDTRVSEWWLTEINTLIERVKK